MAQPYFFHLLSRAARCVVPSLSGPAATQCASAPCASSAALATRMLSDAATLGPGSISDHSMSALRRRLTAVCGNHQHLLSRVGSGMTTSMHRQGLPTPMSAQLRRSIVTSREPDKRASAAELALYWVSSSIFFACRCVCRMACMPFRPVVHVGILSTLTPSPPPLFCRVRHLLAWLECPLPPCHYTRSSAR